MAKIIVRDNYGRFVSVKKHFDTTTDLKMDFYSRVDITTYNDCWIWIAGKTSLGYGQYCIGGKIYYAHRFSWILTNGNVENDLNVLHKCDNPSCVNPNHLYLGTHQDNMRDIKNRKRNPGKRGEDSPNAKLSWDKVEKIKKLKHTENISYRRLGIMFNVSHKTIEYAFKQKTWRQ